MKINTAIKNRIHVTSSHDKQVRNSYEESSKITNQVVKVIHLVLPNKALNKGASLIEGFHQAGAHKKKFKW